jgi:RNase P subunit RPR2
MPAEQEWELIKLWDDYINKAKQSWSSRYTYCTGCFKDVRRDNTTSEVTSDGKLLIKCRSCGTIWYVKDEW